MVAVPSDSLTSGALPIVTTGNGLTTALTVVAVNSSSMKVVPNFLYAN